MIEINLLPQELRKRKIELPNISFLPIITIFLGIIVGTHLLLVLTINLKTRALRRFEKKWQEILPAKESADKLTQELVRMRTNIEVVDTLVRSRISWAKKLSDLSDAMISGVWLNRLWLEKNVIAQAQEQKQEEEMKFEGFKDNSAKARAEPKKSVITTLHLNGSVIATSGEETAAIGKFIRNLKNNLGFFRDFNDIESISIQRSELKGVEVMDFELVCYFK